VNRNSLDNLIALNDEMLSMTRAGMPLDAGLRLMGQQSNRHIGSLANQLADRLEQGEPLPSALAEKRLQLPSFYPILVAVGIESDRLQQVFEMVADSARRLSDVRHQLRRALAYPILVAAISYALFVLGMVFWIPSMQSAFDNFDEEPTLVLRLASIASEWVWLWGPLFPLVIVTLLFQQFRWDRLPLVKQIVLNARTASYLDVVDLFLEQPIPLTTAIRAAGSTGDAKLSIESERLAKRIEQGESVSHTSEMPQQLPPFVRWILLGLIQPGGATVSTYRHALKTAAEEYRQRLDESLHRAVIYAPIVILLIVGLFTLASFLMVLAAPWNQLLEQFAQ
jgi:type II secretory pathway component PulF